MTESRTYGTEDPTFRSSLSPAQSLLSPTIKSGSADEVDHAPIHFVDPSQQHLDDASELWNGPFAPEIEPEEDNGEKMMQYWYVAFWNGEQFSSRRGVSWTCARLTNKYVV